MIEKSNKIETNSDHVKRVKKSGVKEPKFEIVIKLNDSKHTEYRTTKSFEKFCEKFGSKLKLVNHYQNIYYCEIL